MEKYGPFQGRSVVFRHWRKNVIARNTILFRTTRKFSAQEDDRALKILEIKILQGLLERGNEKISSRYYKTRLSRKRAH